MAQKKRGRKRKKNTKEITRPEHEMPGGFWRQVFAVLLIAVAVFSIVTWFGHGGTVLNEIHKWFLTVIGAAVFVLPLLLTYLAVKIFRSETNQVAVAVWLASILMVLWVA